MKTFLAASSLFVGAISLSAIGCAADTSPVADEAKSQPDPVQPEACRPCGPLIDLFVTEVPLPGSTNLYYPGLLFPQNGNLEMEFATNGTGSDSQYLTFNNRITIYNANTGAIVYQGAESDFTTISSIEANPETHLNFEVGPQSNYVNKGLFYVLFEVDYTNDVAETNENNNTFWAKMQLTSGTPLNIEWVPL